MLSRDGEKREPAEATKRGHRSYGGSESKSPGSEHHEPVLCHTIHGTNHQFVARGARPGINRSSLSEAKSAPHFEQL